MVKSFYNQLPPIQNLDDLLRDVDSRIFRDNQPGATNSWQGDFNLVRGEMWSRPPRPDHEEGILAIVALCRAHGALYKDDLED